MPTAGTDTAPARAATAETTPTAETTAAAPQALPAGSPLTLGASRWDYKETNFFKRISEYFSGVENTGYRLILRTDPQQREGLYFQSLLSRPVRELPEGAVFRVRYVRPETGQPVISHSFPLPQDLRSSGKTQLWLGFTGADAPADEAAPVAWQISVEDAEGNPLAETHSFLWSPRDAQ